MPRGIKTATGRNPNWKGGRTVTVWGYIDVQAKGHPRAYRGYVKEHILVAEAALGKYLPDDAVVHHINGDTIDNRSSNLVVCEDQAYHNLLHRRKRALEACGNPNALWCSLCRSYDRQEEIVIRGCSSFRHRSCHARAEREREARKRTP